MERPARRLAAGAHEAAHVERHALGQLLDGEQHAEVVRDRVEAARVHDPRARLHRLGVVVDVHAVDELGLAREVDVVGARRGARGDQRLAVLHVRADRGDDDAGRLGDRRAATHRRSTSACSSGTSTPRRSDSASSLARLRPASAQRTPSPRVAGQVVGGQRAGEPGRAEEDDVVLALGHGRDSMSPRLRMARCGQRWCRFLWWRLACACASSWPWASRARLSSERLRHEPRDERADRSFGDARVDAGLAGLRAAVAEARGADEPQRAVQRLGQQRAAGVALARVRAALRVAGAQHRARVERPPPTGSRPGRPSRSPRRTGSAPARAASCRAAAARPATSGRSRRSWPSSGIPDVALAERPRCARARRSAGRAAAA